ncbi:hypothetical protein XENORESO_004613 [Xenotaenia resolanae]|uniref:Uncharacterized protein n=1 Tax=Xenotaenia resolanae TaxID=208358 RepID=A0ABV0WLW1_9TELE
MMDQHHVGPSLSRPLSHIAINTSESSFKENQRQTPQSEQSSCFCVTGRPPGLNSDVKTIFWSKTLQNILSFCGSENTSTHTWIHAACSVDRSAASRDVCNVYVSAASQLYREVQYSTA